MKFLFALLLTVVALHGELSPKDRDEIRTNYPYMQEAELAPYVEAFRRDNPQHSDWSVGAILRFYAESFATDPHSRSHSEFFERFERLQRRHYDERQRRLLRESALEPRSRLPWERPPIAVRFTNVQWKEMTLPGVVITNTSTKRLNAVLVSTKSENQMKSGLIAAHLEPKQSVTLTNGELHDLMRVREFAWVRFTCEGYDGSVDAYDAEYWKSIRRPSLADFVVLPRSE